MIFLSRSNSFNISSRNPPKPGFPAAGAGAPPIGAGGAAGRVANDGVDTAPGGDVGGPPGVGGIFGGGGNPFPAEGGPDGGPALGSPDGGPALGGPDGGPALGGPDGGPALGGPDGGPALGGPDGGPALGGPDGGPALGGPDGGPALGSPDGGPALGGPDGGSGFEGSGGSSTETEEGAKLGALSNELVVSTGLLVDNILNNNDAAFSRAAPLPPETVR